MEAHCPAGRNSRVTCTDAKPQPNGTSSTMAATSCGTNDHHASAACRSACILFALLTLSTKTVLPPSINMYAQAASDHTHRWKGTQRMQSKESPRQTVETFLTKHQMRLTPNGTRHNQHTLQTMDRVNLHAQAASPWKHRWSLSHAVGGRATCDCASTCPVPRALGAPENAHSLF